MSWEGPLLNELGSTSIFPTYNDFVTLPQYVNLVDVGFGDTGLPPINQIAFANSTLSARPQLFIVGYTGVLSATFCHPRSSLKHRCHHHANRWKTPMEI